METESRQHECTGGEVARRSEPARIWSERNIGVIMAKNRALLDEERRRGRPRIQRRPSAYSHTDASKISALSTLRAKEGSSILTNFTHFANTALNSMIQHISAPVDDELKRDGCWKASFDAQRTGDVQDSNHRAISSKDIHENSASDCVPKKMNMHTYRPRDTVESNYLIPLDTPVNHNRHAASVRDRELDLSYLRTMGLEDADFWPTSGIIRCCCCKDFVKDFEGVILKNCRKHRVCKKCLVKDRRIVSSCPVDLCDASIRTEEITALRKIVAHLIDSVASTKQVVGALPTTHSALRDESPSSSGNEVHTPLTVAEENYIDTLGLYGRPLWPTFLETKCNKCTEVIPSMDGFVIKTCQIHKICKGCFQEAIRKNQNKPLCPLFEACQGSITEEEIAEFVKIHGPVTTRTKSSKEVDRHGGEWETPKKPIKNSKKPAGGETKSNNECKEGGGGRANETNKDKKKGTQKKKGV